MRAIWRCKFYVNLIFPGSYYVYNCHSNSMIFLAAMLNTSYFYLNLMHKVKTQRSGEFFVKNMLIF